MGLSAIWNTRQSWGIVARVLHWLVGGLILFMLGLGVYMSRFVEDPFEQFDFVQLHKSWGFVVFCLALLRIGWRLVNRRSPALPPSMPPIMQWAAHLGHIGLYVLTLLLPISGWLASSASTVQDLLGIKNQVFGLFEMYDPFVPGNDQLADFFALIHFLSGIALAALLLAHVGAAAYHHIYRRDDVLKRMSYGQIK